MLKAILDKLDIKKLMQEFVLRKDNRRSLFGKYFNLMLIGHYRRKIKGRKG